MKDPRHLEILKFYQANNARQPSHRSTASSPPQLQTSSLLAGSHAHTAALKRGEGRQGEGTSNSGSGAAPHSSATGWAWAREKPCSSSGWILWFHELDLAHRPHVADLWPRQNSQRTTDLSSQSEGGKMEPHSSYKKPHGTGQKILLSPQKE